MILVIKALAGASIAIFLHFVVKSDKSFLAGLVPLFPAFALLAHIMFALDGRFNLAVGAARFGLFALAPYAVYLLVVMRFAGSNGPLVVLISATLAWAIVAAIGVAYWKP